MSRTEGQLSSFELSGRRKGGRLQRRFVDVKEGGRAEGWCDRGEGQRQGDMEEDDLLWKLLNGAAEKRETLTFALMGRPKHEKRMGSLSAPQPVQKRTGGLSSPAEMFKTEKLKALVNDRLQAAAEEIFSLFEEAVRCYEKEMFRSKQEIEQQQRRLAGCKAPSVQEDGAPSEQDHPERKTDLYEDDPESRIKEEQGVELLSACEKREEADTKDSVFNIIYVERTEDGTHSPNLCKTVGNNEKDHWPSCSSQTAEQSCDASEPTSPSREISDDEQRDSGELHSGLNSQKRQKSGERVDRPYTCSVCNKNFRIKSILMRHMKTHTGEKPHSCSVCGKSFIQRSYLQTHMNSHSGQKPYTCSFCGKGFTQVGNMNAHMRIHTGEKPHSCDDCGKKFREKADLIKHTVIHTGEKPYSCAMCDIKFSAQSNLTRHMKTHSGERPYSCTACGKRFIRRSHLIVHMKTHTGENI